MLLSNYLLSGGVKPYLEYGWVTAPNTARQSITANTITTLTIDTEVADTGNNGSISGNQITLNAGTYYFKGHANIRNAAPTANLISLFNVTSSSYVTRGGPLSGGAEYAASSYIEGQFTINTQSVFEFRVLTSTISLVGSSITDGIFSLSTAGADQRTTIKLWKLA
jgi:hypothetical protein